MFNFTEIFNKFKFNFLNSFEVYFDLGTTESKIAIKDKGIILRESTSIAYNTRTSSYIFFGNEARSIIGKTPEYIKIIKPIINGVIFDFDSQVALNKKFIEQSAYIYLKNMILKSNIIGFSVVPSIATEIEQKALEESLLKSGIADVFLIEKALATATGCGIDIFFHKPYLVIDLGGGLIEIFIVGSGGIINQKTLKIAGEHMNKLIYNYIYFKYGVILGEATCEELKINLLTFDNKEKTIVVRGKSLENGLPKSIKVKTSDIKEALLPAFNQIIDSIKELIESSPPEIINELIENGLYITGGLSKIEKIDYFFEQELKIKTKTNEVFSYATINGLIKLAKDKEKLEKIILNKN